MCWPHRVGVSVCHLALLLLDLSPVQTDATISNILLAVVGSAEVGSSVLEVVCKRTQYVQLLNSAKTCSVSREGYDP